MKKKKNRGARKQEKDWVFSIWFWFICWSLSFFCPTDPSCFWTVSYFPLFIFSYHVFRCFLCTIFRWGCLCFGAEGAKIWSFWGFDELGFIIYVMQMILDHMALRLSLILSLSIGWFFSLDCCIFMLFFLLVAAVVYRKLSIYLS